MNDLLAQANALGQAASRQTGVSFTPINPSQGGTTANPQTTISADTIANPPARLTIPTANPSTTAEGLLGAAEAQNIQTMNALNAERQAAQTNLQTSQKGLKDRLSELISVVQSRPQMEEQAGISTKSQTLVDATNNLEASRRAQTNELRALDKAGLTDVQRAARAQEINRRYAFEQADLSLIQSAANRDFEAAQAMVDRKINLAVEPLKLQLDFDKMFYEENRDAFTRAEQRQFEQRIRTDERNYNRVLQQVQTLETTKLSLLQSASAQGAPSAVLSAIQRANTPEAAMIAAGQYAGDILDRRIKLAQIEKLNAEAEKDRKAGLADVNNPIPYQVGTPQYNAALIARSSQFDKGLDQDQRNRVSASKQALSGLETLTTLVQGGTISNADAKALFGEGTGAIRGRLRTLAAQLGGDAGAAQINATIQGLVPTVARGIFGEVGVLTDQDIANYKRTIGDINSPENANKAVQYILADVLKNTYTNTLTDAARNRQNVSGFADEFQANITRIENLQRGLIGQNQSQANQNPFQSSLSTPTGFFNPQTGTFQIPQ